jgi:hypothetical protein
MTISLLFQTIKNEVRETVILTNFGNFFDVFTSGLFYSLFFTLIHYSKLGPLRWKAGRRKGYKKITAD